MKHMVAACAAGLLAALPGSARAEDFGVRPFATAGIAKLRSPLDFDRLSPGKGTGPAATTGIGLEASVGGFRIAAHGVRIWNANDDGADIDFGLGEVRVPLTDLAGAWMAVGGGRITGRGRKSSWVETLAIGKDLGSRRFAEVRVVMDELDGRLATAALGWRF